MANAALGGDAKVVVGGDYITSEGGTGLVDRPSGNVATAFETTGLAHGIQGAGRGTAAGRDADMPRGRTKIDGRRRSRGRATAFETITA